MALQFDSYLQKMFKNNHQYLVLLLKLSGIIENRKNCNSTVTSLSISLFVGINESVERKQPTKEVDE